MQLIYKHLLKKTRSLFLRIHKVEKSIQYFESGRGALDAILRIVKKQNKNTKLKIGLIPYTCCVVPAVCLANNYELVWLDIENETYSIDFGFLEKTYSLEKFSVIILQSTYGLVPRDYSKIIQLCKRENIIIIEDISHSLACEKDNTPLGTYSNFSFGSFQRSKQISVWEGGFSLGLTDSQILDLDLPTSKLDITSILCFIEAFGNKWPLLKKLSNLANIFIRSRGMTPEEKSGEVLAIRKKLMGTLKLLILSIGLSLSKNKINNGRSKFQKLMKANPLAFKKILSLEFKHNCLNSYLRLPVKNSYLNKSLEPFVKKPFWFNNSEPFFNRFEFDKLKNFQKTVTRNDMSNISTL
jgi:hypothetical protein